MWYYIGEMTYFFAYFQKINNNEVVNSQLRGPRVLSMRIEEGHDHPLSG
jgi:hypothetical protein